MKLAPKLPLTGVVAAALLLAATIGSSVPAQAQDAASLTAVTAPAGAVWLDSLDLKNVTQGWGTPQKGKSVDGNPIKVHGVTYPHGIGSHANSQIEIDLAGNATRFLAMGGMDDEVGTKGTVRFQVYVDGKRVDGTRTVKGGDEGKLFDIDLTGAKRLSLQIWDVDGNENDHADWAGAMIVMKPGAKMPSIVPNDTSKPVKIASITAGKPEIHGPRVVGTTPGHDFIFLIPAISKNPLKYEAKGLPAGLKLDPATGIISGKVLKEGTYPVELKVSDKKDVASRKLTIIAGKNKLAQTPPMGWNSWNCWAGAIDDAKVRAAADAMVKSGLAAHGYQYINIDDTWEAGRDENGEIQCNAKFPDMKALADYVHSKGLRLGIYSSPGPRTCANFEGSYKHELQDAKTYAKWGIDYLKYDWCAYSEVAKDRSLPELQKPYYVMQEALGQCGRDIVYSLCQYGWGNVWEWGEKVGGNCWRTTGDINDSWGSMSGIGFSQDGHEKFAGPGHWNDPDMLVVGNVGWSANLHPSRLTQSEQITHISLWSLQSAPLLIGCDMTALDKFTSDLLMNDEVIAVNQDPLGKPAGAVAKVETTQVWARPLSDGTMAVGLFNLDTMPAKVTAKWSDLKLKGAQPVRDLWLRKDLGVKKDEFSVEVPAHGAVLVKIGKPAVAE